LRKVNEMHADTRIPLVLLLLVALQPAVADPVYSWVDASGITHFSQMPPPQGTEQAMQLELPRYPAAPLPDDDYYSVANQAARMEFRRLEREKLEAQRRLAEAEARRARAEAQAASESARQQPPAVSYPYLPWQPARAWRPHRHHPHRHHRDYGDRREHHPAQMPYHRYGPADFRLNRPPAMTLSGQR
jgi:hypothetical protein